MTRGAVATSGSYENFYDEDRVFHHIIDPRTGRSPQRCVSATVRAHSVTVADALSTAVFVLGPRAGLDLVDRIAGVELLIVDASGGRHRSKGWEAATA